MSGPDENELGALSEAECVALLARHTFGRLAFWSDDAPLILPVNYVFAAPDIIIRTGPGSKLDQTPLRRVAFEIDDVDRLGLWGWSVVAQGAAFEITDSIDEHSEALRKLVVTPWAPGTRSSWLRIAAAHVSGRYFGSLPHEFFDVLDRL